MSGQSSSTRADYHLTQFGHDHARVVSALKTLVVFVLVWPLTCGLIVGTWWSLLLHLRFGPLPDSRTLVFEVTSTVFLFYVLGLLPVCILALIVSAAQARWRSFGMGHIAAIGLFAGMVVAVLHFDIGADTAMWVERLVRITAAVASTLLCWSVARLWRADQAP